MRAPHFVLALLVGVGVVASIAVIPRDRELALMYLKGLDYESAQAALEERLNAGDLSVGVVIPLTKVYLETGDFDAAVGLMERFVALNPDESDGRSELAQLYKQANRVYDYISTLSEFVRIRPTQKALYELSDYYNSRGEIDKQVEVLRVLVRRFTARMDDWIDLAQIEADLGNFEAAASALSELGRRFKVPRTQHTVEFYVSVLARTGREGEALEFALSWLAEAKTASSALGVVRQFIGAGKEREALAALDRLDSVLAEVPVLFSERIRLELRLGRREMAFQRLRAAYASGRLAIDLDDAMIDLALERNLVPLALTLALKGSPMRLPDWQLSSLVGMSPPERAGEVAKWILAAPEFLDRRPVLAASVLKTVGDSKRALAMADKALANQADLSGDQLLSLLLIFADLGRADDARRQLRNLLDRFGWEEAIALDLANAMIRLGQAPEGWRRIQAVRDRQRQRSPGIDAAWALLSAATGLADQVVEWLDATQASQFDPEILAQLGDLAELNGQAKLAFAAARHLVAIRDSEGAHLRLAGAFAALGRFDEALAEVRPLKANSPEAERIYLTSLAMLARRGGAEAQAELSEFWRRHLARPDLDVETLAALVNSLLEKGLGAESLPAIYWLAGRAPEAWYSAAMEEAKKAKRQPEARSFFANQLARTDLSSDLREQALFALNEVGGIGEALPEIARLARTDPTDKWFYAYLDAAKKARSTDTKAFLAAELKRTDLTRVRREARLYAYLELVGPEEALPEIKRFAEGYGGDWANAYDEALAKLGRTEERRRLLVERAARPGVRAEERREIAYRLIDIGDREAAIGVFRALAQSAGPDDTAVSELIYLWRETGRLLEATEWIAGRGTSAPPADRPAWARQLIDAEAPARALAVLGPSTAGETEGAAAVRIDALIALKRMEEAGRIIAARAENETDVPRLRRLARQGLDTDRREALKVVYGRLARAVPGDPEAERWLGLADVAEGRPGLARRHLAQVIDTPVADHEVHYAYGEILFQASEKDAARFHFRRALDQIDAMPEQPVPLRVVRAQLLNRLGDSGPALALMAALVAERPADPGLRADYANLLMDNKLYDKARQVLSGR